jgi:C-terminal processing protease CtpA/Prc
MKPIDSWPQPPHLAGRQAARLRDIARVFTQGPCGSSAVVVQRGNTNVSVASTRVPITSVDLTGNSTHDLPGDAFQMLTSDIAYIKLSSVVAANSASCVQSAAATKGLIIDIRNYPSNFVVYTLGQLLVPQTTAFARATGVDITTPGAIHWQVPMTLIPQQPQYPGKVVVLVDEVTESQAEFTTAAFRSAPGVIVIGSTTAGADGNVTTFSLPGGWTSYFSGLGVFYPDNRPTQRVGIVPDIFIQPTIEGCFRHQMLLRRPRRSIVSRECGCRI